jgi:CheY-like chemotaxis protein
MTIKILVVDDEPLYLRLLKVNLESEGYEIITARNGEEALEQVSQAIPNLIIMDVMMPKMDGIAAHYLTNRINRRTGSCQRPEYRRGRLRF